MINANRATEFPGVYLSNVVGLFSGIGLPWDEIFNQKINARYYRANGETYKAVGTGTTPDDWERLLDPPVGSIGLEVAYENADGSESFFRLEECGTEIPFENADGSITNVVVT